jgi:hypothetical protein
MFSLSSILNGKASRICIVYVRGGPKRAYFSGYILQSDFGVQVLVEGGIEVDFGKWDSYEKPYSTVQVALWPSRVRLRYVRMVRRATAEKDSGETEHE